MGSAIADVAARAGVSKATASRALSGNGYVAAKTRAAVIQAAKEIGYVASPDAAGLVTGQKKNIGVVVPFVNRWYFGEVLEGVEEALLDNGYDLGLYNLHPASTDRNRVFDFFLARKRFDGVIIIGIEPSAEEVEKLTRLDVPLISIGGPVDGIRSLTIDEIGIARMATEHLIGLGHRHIAHIGGTLASEFGSTVHSKRLIGYQEAMREAGLEHELRFEATTMSVPGGYEAAVQVLSEAGTRPTAIFAACDEIAIGTIVAARRIGVTVPGDLSVIGIDGHEYAEMFSLTTVEQNPRSLGTAAVAEMLGTIDGAPAEPSVVEASTRLIMRASTTYPAHVDA